MINQEELKKSVADYKKCFMSGNTKTASILLDDSCCDDEKGLLFYRQRSFDEAIQNWAKRKDGKRHGHQVRLKETAIQEMIRKAKNRKDELRKCNSFSELFAISHSLRKEIPGIGDLAEYDFAFRVGLSCKLEPEKVYLHAGTKKGAMLLLRKEDIRGRRCVEAAVFPSPLNSLPPYHIEIFLCIMNHQKQEY